MEQHQDVDATRPNNEVGSLLSLPEEIIISSICPRLSPRAVTRLGLTNSLFHRLVQDGHLWRSLCQRWLTTSEQESKPERSGWREYFCELRLTEYQFKKGLFRPRILLASAMYLAKVAFAFDLAESYRFGFYYPPSHQAPTLVVRVVASYQQWVLESWNLQTSESSTQHEQRQRLLLQQLQYPLFQRQMQGDERLHAPQSYQLYVQGLQKQIQQQQLILQQQPEAASQFLGAVLALLLPACEASVGSLSVSADETLLDLCAVVRGAGKLPNPGDNPYEDKIIALLPIAPENFPTQPETTITDISDALSLAPSFTPGLLYNPVCQLRYTCGEGSQQFYGLRIYCTETHRGEVFVKDRSVSLVGVHPKMRIIRPIDTLGFDPSKVLWQGDRYVVMYRYWDSDPRIMVWDREHSACSSDVPAIAVLRLDGFDLRCVDKCGSVLAAGMLDEAENCKVLVMDLKNLPYGQDELKSVAECTVEQVGQLWAFGRARPMHIRVDEKGVVLDIGNVLRGFLFKGDCNVITFASPTEVPRGIEKYGCLNKVVVAVVKGGRLRVWERKTGRLLQDVDLGIRPTQSNLDLTVHMWLRQGRIIVDNGPQIAVVDLKTFQPTQLKQSEEEEGGTERGSKRKRSALGDKDN